MSKGWLPVREVGSLGLLAGLGQGAETFSMVGLEEA